jgi:hypothetical protein
VWSSNDGAQASPGKALEHGRLALPGEAGEVASVLASPVEPCGPTSRSIRKGVTHKAEPETCSDTTHYARTHSPSPGKDSSHTENRQQVPQKVNPDHMDRSVSTEEAAMVSKAAERVPITVNYVPGVGLKFFKTPHGTDPRACAQMLPRSSSQGRDSEDGHETDGKEDADAPPPDSATPASEQVSLGFMKIRLYKAAHQSLFHIFCPGTWPVFESY